MLLLALLTVVVVPVVIVTVYIPLVIVPLVDVHAFEVAFVVGEVLGSLWELLVYFGEGVGMEGDFGRLGSGLDLGGTVVQLVVDEELLDGVVAAGLVHQPRVALELALGLVVGLADLAPVGLDDVELVHYLVVVDLAVLFQLQTPLLPLGGRRLLGGH